MPNRTGAIARAISERVGWNTVGITVSVLIVGVAGFVLWHLLRDIELDRITVALRAQSSRDVLMAACFVAAGYVTLTFYDFFALRTIGQNNVPYRIAALASFTSYTIGHNLGATVLTGGVIRLRIYSAWGLNIVDIAKIAFVTGLTFWLGNTFVLGCALIYAPEAASAIDQLPGWVNRLIGAAGLLVIAGYLGWLAVKPRPIGRGNWQIVLPNARLTMVQIGIGILDLGCGALAMYMLVPATPVVDFPTLLVIFVVAMLLGFLSHAPGSLGVIEAAMLLGLPQFPKEELLASLLIFRVLYFVVPVSLAALTLGCREAWL